MEFSYLRKCVDNDSTGIDYTGSYSEFLKSLFCFEEQQCNLERKISLTAYLDTDFGVCEFFKGGANVSTTS